MVLPRQLYIPEGTGGRAKYSACSTKDAPDSIEFIIDGITLDAKVAAASDGRHFVELRFVVPGDKVANLQDDKVTFSWASKRPNSESVFEKISLVDGAIINMHRPALQQYMRAVREPMVGYRNFWLATYITPPPDGDFSMVLPSISVNGTLVTLPEVRFRKGPLAIIAPINC